MRTIAVLRHRVFGVRLSRQRVEELLKPDGEVMGIPPRQRTMVRRVVVSLPASEARELFEQLAELGSEAATGNPTRGSRPGRLVEIPGLGYVGYRETPTPTVDVNVSIEGLRNVKFKFVRGETRSDNEHGGGGA